MPKAPRQYGPISTHAIKYAVTAGSLSFLKTLVIMRPASRAIEVDNNVVNVIHLLSKKKFQLYEYITNKR